MASWKSIEEAAFELRFKELVIKCGYEEKGGNYMYCYPLESMGDSFQEIPQNPKSTDAQVLL